MLYIVPALFLATYVNAKLRVEIYKLRIANCKTRRSDTVEYARSHELVSTRLESTIEAYEESEEAAIQDLATVIKDEDDKY